MWFKAAVNGTSSTIWLVVADFFDDLLCILDPYVYFPLQVIDVVHPGKAAQSKTELQAQVAKLHKADAKLVTLYGFKTTFGGGRSSGFGLIYDNLEAMKKFEPKHRLIRKEEATKKTRTRKQWKDLKRKLKRTWGTGRREQARAAKKAAAS